MVTKRFLVARNCVLFLKDDMTKIKLTKEELIELLITKSATQIGKDYGVSTTTVTNLMKKFGIEVKKQKLDLNNDVIINRYKSGESARSIAISLNVDHRTVKRILKSYDVQIKHPGTRNYKLNENIFSKIDNIESAYWLGFLLADGHLTAKNGIKISLAKYDTHLLIKFAKFVNCDNPKIHGTKRRHPKATFLVQSKKIGDDLRSIGFDEWKNGSNSDILKHIPNELFNHFIRGYFDGDGSVSYQRISLKSGIKGKKMHWSSSIVCKYENHLHAIFNKLPDNSIAKVKKRNNVYSLLFSNISNSKQFAEYIYRDSGDLFLDRKKVRFDILNGVYPFYMRTIHDFYIPRDVNRTSIVNQFTECLMRTGWKPKKNKFSDFYEDVVDALDRIYDTDLKVSQNPDNGLIEHCQPWVNWIKLNNGHPIAEFRDKPKMVRRAVAAFLESGSLACERLVREMRFVGFTRASLLSSATLVRIIRYFNLSGSWFDPCAGWGNRLLCADYLDLKYSACDPGISFDGLVYLKKQLKNDAILQNKKWQDATWPEKCDFILTSPPFFDKEDYLDGVNYGKFDVWCNDFLRPLVEKSISVTGKVLFHVDEPMARFLETLGFVSHELQIPNRSKTSKEFISCFDK